MQPSLFVAIDPGASGGHVARSHAGDLVEVCAYTGPKDVLRLCDELRAVPKSVAVSAVIERVWASPVMGVSSAFAFGENYGYWVGALRSAGVPVFAVSPQAWQKVAVPAITGQGPERKRALKLAAQERHRDARVTLAVCDALLLSDYALVQHRAGKPLGEAL